MVALKTGVLVCAVKKRNRYESKEGSLNIVRGLDGECKYSYDVEMKGWAKKSYRMSPEKKNLCAD